jgi:Uma2 family endonuclease
MIAVRETNYLTPEEYLELEEKGNVKHEYINGEIYTMAGASDSHVTIALNIASELRNHLRGKGCRVFISDMKVRINQRNCYYYPDILVTCESKDQETPNYKQYPQVIIEVLSPSTEAFDRGDKFADYQTLETLEEYILINSKKPRVECFRRGENNSWILTIYTPENNHQFEIKTLDFQGDLNLIYEDITFVSPAENNKITKEQ